MTNRDNGTGLEPSILRDIARLYHWPLLRILVG
ncbi:hypothetical protein NB710_003639 [Xanthomonas sacchari]|nr:hypothetical protein [Xanthomonas sacchari]MCW0424128.1 hypothetical protein [Xanthomonas sacchari]